MKVFPKYLLRLVKRFGLVVTIGFITLVTFTFSELISIMSVAITVDDPMWIPTVIIPFLCSVVIAPPISYIALRLIIMLDRSNSERELALSEVKELSALIPICSSCRKLRDYKGYWDSLESYLSKHTNSELTHGICPDCKEDLYGEFLRKENKDMENCGC